MKRSNVDLIVGGSILIALFILVGGVLWLKEASVTRKLVSYAVLFPDVGTLQVGDPVSANGVKKGSVASIRLRGTRVAVIIDLERDVGLTDSCRIIVQNIGLMGERGIGIQLSDKGSAQKPNSGKDTTFMPGYFDTGIAEAMGMLGVVLTEVQELAVNVSSIVESTVGDSAFLKLFHTMVARLDTLTEVAEAIVVKNQPHIDKSMKNISAISSDLKSLLDRNSNHLDAIIANGDSLSSYALAITARIESLTESVQNIVGQVERGEGSLGLLVKDENFYHDLKRTVANLDTLVTEVQDDALKLRVKIGFGRKKKN